MYMHVCTHTYIKIIQTNTYDIMHIYFILLFDVFYVSDIFIDNIVLGLLYSR